MPRTAGVSVPKYRNHKASGQAIVTIQGRDHYLGPWKSKASRIEYDRLISEWMASGRPNTAPAGQNERTIKELLAAYWLFAEQHYRKDGQPTRELDNIRFAVRPLKELYGHTLVRNFGPLSLKALQQRMIEAKLSRGVVNQRIGKIKRVFRWAVSEELAPPSLCHALDAVAGLQRGRTAARETDPVGPVEDAVVDATLPFMPPIVADMVRVQRLTGARPNEICIVRPCDIDRSQPIWRYRPASHKTAHHGRDRLITIGPKAQDVLRPYLLRDSTAYCFSPIEAESARKAQLREVRKTRVQPSQLDRRKGNAKRKPGSRLAFPRTRAVRCKDRQRMEIPNRAMDHRFERSD